MSANAELRDQLAAAEAKQAKMEAELTSVRETHGTDGESIQQLKDLCALLQVVICLLFFCIICVYTCAVLPYHIY